MAENWIEVQRDKLAEIYRECEERGELILTALSLYLCRILNGLAQMEESDAYGYEGQILWKAMRLFCIYYVEQVEEVLKKQSDNEKKEEIIENLEDAISKISNVYKNVIDSTSNADRQLFTSHAVGTSIYDISPKLFATYSMILETLVALFGQQDLYAFLPHPSLKSNVETVSLFDVRQRPGKVVLIYIPENRIEKVRLIPFYFLHEAFHVLTKDERCRKERACMMQIHMFNVIFQRLFRDVTFTLADEDTDREIKNELMQQWFKTEERMEELRNRENDDRKLYSRNVIVEICKEWKNSLQNISVSLGNDLSQALKGKNCWQEENLYYVLWKAEEGIRKNLLEILANNDVERYVEIYMQIYKEAYADIASILTAGISPSIYEEAFQKSRVGQTDNVLEEDALREIRIYLVAKTVLSCDGIAYKNEWEEYCNTHDPQKINAHVDGKKVTGEEEICQSSKFRIQETDLDAFGTILEESGRKLWAELDKENILVERFRKILQEIDILNILKGKTNRQLMELKREVEHKRKSDS